MIKLNLSLLTHARVGYRDSLVLDLENLVLDDIVLNYLRGKLHFTRINHGILCEGVLDAEIQVECTRCLTPSFNPISIELEHTISLPGAALTSEHPVCVTADGWVDFAPLIREYAWLEVPYNIVCTPECLGLCSECGGNLNLDQCTCGSKVFIDPRWAALRTLLPESDKDIPKKQSF